MLLLSLSSHQTYYVMSATIETDESDAKDRKNEESAKQLRRLELIRADAIKTKPRSSGILR